MELTDELKAFFIETAKTLKGSDRRIFMARVVKALANNSPWFLFIVTEYVLGCFILAYLQ